MNIKLLPFNDSMILVTSIFSKLVRHSELADTSDIQQSQ